MAVLSKEKRVTKCQHSRLEQRWSRRRVSIVLTSFQNFVRNVGVYSWQMNNQVPEFTRPGGQTETSHPNTGF